MGPGFQILDRHTLSEPLLRQIKLMIKWLSHGREASQNGESTEARTREQLHICSVCRNTILALNLWIVSIVLWENLYYQQQFVFAEPQQYLSVAFLLHYVNYNLIGLKGVSLTAPGHHKAPYRCMACSYHTVTSILFHNSHSKIFYRRNASLVSGLILFAHTMMNWSWY